MNIIRSGLVAFALAGTAGFALAEDVKVDGKVTDVFGRRVVVETSGGKALIDLGARGKDALAVKMGDKLTVEGDRRSDEEIIAWRVTRADGKTYNLQKKTWKEWLLGKEAGGERGMFDAAQAKKFATEKGYNVVDEPKPEKKHFVVMGTKAGKTYELDVHRDGDVEEHAVFGMDAARSAVTGKGYSIVGQPVAEKKHFEMLTKKGEAFYEVHAHRDGRVVEVRTVSPNDPKWGNQVK